MKKTKFVLFKLTAITLLLAGTVACQSKDIATTILPETAVDENINVFFSNTLPVTTVSNCFFTAVDNDACYIIDSADELKKMCACPDDLPEIDFTHYSLIIGKKGVPNSFYTVLEQKIIKMQESLTLTVKLHLGDHWPAFSTLYHWGLYPKLSNNKNLNVEYLF